jgi:hypothetical protein
VKLQVADSSNLFDYFNQRVDKAVDRAALPVSDDTRLYLATLLVDRARTDTPRPEAHTLVELHARASQAPPAESARTYRELGDRALYAVGYFEESLERRVVGPDYYVEMGRAAYWRVDEVFKRWFADAFGPVFRELAEQFQGCVSVISSIRDEHDSPDDVVRLYQRWLETQDEGLAVRLRQKGLLLADGIEE